ncbi:hypothetical protein LSCM1_06785 [Leishmania martiniquensis]|uniref:J domain-containing protein n=1 Tax=Leishmania martiniquensis TaxID=1580590 RepID=A0A836GXU3_9TRYP|nr:hypothetical protein LSCM1_06785 [Leishmania martiniquensis]
MEDRRHYEVLCIPKFSSVEEVRVAYKSLALKYHPDKNLGDPTAADRFRAVSRAYEVLSNEETKRKYDLALRAALYTYGLHTSGTAGGQGGSNLYSMNSPMSDAYRELFQRQAARASTRNRPSSAPPQSGKAAASQYTKEQQEHFRRRERERQQELRRQREKERREQRDREREALRKEQERQEELLQQRWRQQQQQHQQRGHLMRTPRTTTAAAAASASTAVNSNCAANGDGSNSASPRIRSGLPRVSMTEGLRSANESYAPNRVLLGTPVRLTTSLRSGAGATPRTCRAGSSVSPSRQPAANLASPGACTSGAPSPSSAWREETVDAEALAGGSSMGWRTPFTTYVNDGDAEEGAGYFSSRSSCAGSAVGAQEQRSARSKGVYHAPRKTPASAAGGDARPAVSAPESASTKHTTSEDHSEDGAADGCGDSRHHPSPSYRPATRIRTVSGDAGPYAVSGSPTPRNGGTPRGFTRLRASPAASPASMGASPRGQRGTPCGVSSAQATANSRNHSSPAGASVPGSRVIYTLHRNSGGTLGTTSSSISPVHSTLIHRARSMASLASDDKEVLDKNRRERLAKELERQRAARFAEEGRQQRRLARAAKQQRSHAAAAAVESEAEEPQSFERQLRYLLQDEASERDQLIEREEQLARRRLHRQHTAAIQAVVLRPCLGVLTAEEKALRDILLQWFRTERDFHFFHFYERLDRLYVEGREGRYRRQLVGRETADRYHVQRISQRRDSKVAEEASQWRRLSGSDMQPLARQGLPVEVAGGHSSTSATESRIRQRTVFNVHEEAAPPSHWAEVDARLAGSHPCQQHESRHYHEHLDEGLRPASYLLPTTAPAAGTISILSVTRDGTSSAISSAAVPEVSTAGYPTFFLSVPTAPEGPATMADRLAGDSASTRTSAQASRYASPIQRRSSASLANTDGAASTLYSSTNGEPKVQPPGSDRRLLTLLSDEARQRGLLMRQQQQEEIALRRRRAAAMHRVFAKDKENAIKHAQRCAMMEVAALKAQIRMLQRQIGCCSSLRDLEGGSLAAPASAASGSPLHSASWRAESTIGSRRGSPAPLPPRLTTDGTPATSALPSNTARASSAASTFTALATLSGWTALPDSEAEDE